MFLNRSDDSYEIVVSSTSEATTPSSITFPSHTEQDGQIGIQSYLIILFGGALFVVIWAFFIFLFFARGNRGDDDDGGPNCCLLHRNPHLRVWRISSIISGDTLSIKSDSPPNYDTVMNSKQFPPVILNQNYVPPPPSEPSPSVILNPACLLQNLHHEPPPEYNDALGCKPK